MQIREPYKYCQIIQEWKWNTHLSVHGYIHSSYTHIMSVKWWMINNLTPNTP